MVTAMPAKTIKSKVLGVIKYDKELDWWTAKLELMKGLKITVHINNQMDMGKVVSAVEERLARLRKDEPSLREYAAKKLLKLANEWSEGEKVTKDDFVSRMCLEAIEFYNDLSMGLYFDDGDLFWGHTITVDIDKNGKCTRAEFQG
jgi:hypothetical protein